MSIRLQSGPTTMYAQLSMILRSKIMGGEWPEGFEIPTLGDLCEQYNVARVTARQAVQILVQEGLLSSQRGRRTSVSYVRPLRDAEPLFTSIGSALSDRPNYSIDVLEQSERAALLDQHFAGTPAGPYMFVRKVDREGGDPYAYSENYISRELFDRFPAGAVSTSKLARLVRHHADPPLALAQERLRVAAADYEAAQHLGCIMSAPVARIDRVFYDADDRIVYFGQFIYRGDRFAVEHDITPHIVGPSEG